MGYSDQNLGGESRSAGRADETDAQELGLHVGDSSPFTSGYRGCVNSFGTPRLRHRLAVAKNKNPSLSARGIVHLVGYTSEQQ